jgi:hypothetical protein
MENRTRLEVAAAAAASAACLAFVLSFGLGLRRSGEVEVSDAAPVTAVEETGRARGRLEVLNASGKAGLARAATDQLRSAGFDVVYFGNAPAASGDSSVVIDRIGSDGIARAAAQQIGIARVRSVKDTTLFLDATVVIGKDWPPESERVQKEEGWKARISRWLGRS